MTNVKLYATAFLSSWTINNAQIPNGYARNDLMKIMLKMNNQW